MNTLTIADIRALRPCYNPARYLPEDWQGTVVDILKVNECPAADRLWVVLREDWIDNRTLRLFAVWCARLALALVDNPNPRSVTACDVAERYANGEATADELDAAWYAAMYAARDAAMYAAMYAARAAAMYAARDAAMYAAMDAARDAAMYAARAAAMDAARAAAMDAAWYAARDAQIAYLIEMLDRQHG